MKIWHRGHIGIQHRVFLENEGIEHKPWFSAIDQTRINSYMFVICENDPAWPSVQEMLKGDHTYISTDFTKKEISDAEWSMGHARHSVGAVRCGKDAWSEEYFADQCECCGSGWRQIAPFRIKREPKMGKKVFADFGSAFELFCTPAVLASFTDHGISGFEVQPLILNKENQPAEGLKQLLVSEIAQPAIAEELVEHERYGQTDCPVCGNTWHSHYTRGALPLRRSALVANTDFQLTHEWFGNGRTARREILFSRRVVNLALENKWKGIQFIPVNTV